MGKRVPMPGDAVRWDVPPGRSQLIKPGAIGIIDGMLGEPKECYLVTWNCQGTCYRGELGEERAYVSASGGPACYVLADRMKPTGKTVRFRFWRWKNPKLPAAHAGVDYQLEVPLWSWSAD
jgi:hypothetical protein